jgi:hypothetical protein
MPVTPSAISLAISGQLSAAGFSGRNDFDIASAVGNAVGNYLILPNLVTGTLNGTAGVTASVNSIALVGLIPQSMGTLMVQRASGSNITGRDAFKFFNAIATGISTVVQTAFLTGTALGIGPGAGTGRFTALNEQALSKLILAQFFSKNLTGRDVSTISDAVAFGVVNHLLTTTFTLSALGAVAPVPPAGPVAVVGIPTVTTKIS